MAMEITGQMASFEDELKLLKGEVKSILEEIRAALLDRDSPFSPQVQANLESVKAIMAEREAVLAARPDLPVFHPVERPGATTEPDAAPPAEGPTTPPEPVPPPATEGPRTPPGPVAGAATGEQMSDASPPEPPTQAGPPPRAEAAGSSPGAAQTRGAAEPAPEQPVPDEPYPEPWTVSTIASLVAWIDESSSRLGAAHLQMILDLARFAGLLPSDAQDVLLKVIKLATGRKDSSAPSVNDILLALRQLEAILAGDEADDLSLVRRRRIAGRNR